MNTKEANAIMRTLPRGKTKFYYFKDRYALMLLKYAAGSGVPIGSLKRSNFGRLLNKPILKEVLKEKGNGSISAEELDSYWTRETECYFLSVGLWQGKERNWDQTSRRGVNMVLHLNFTSKHNEPYYRLVDPEKRHPFVFSSHPHAPKGYLTLAWTRLDIDMAHGEALIEELQNDWLREACDERKYLKRRVEDIESKRRVYSPENEQYLKKAYRDINRYIERVLSPHMRMWQEATLSATLWFLRDVLQVERIFYHTFETGRKLKRIGWSSPPRSIYTALPRKFCFTETQNVPSLLRKDRSKHLRNLLKNDTRFFMLELS